MGSSLRSSADIAAISSFGKASGAGLPAANEMTSGSDVNLSISRIAEAWSLLTLSENLYSMIKIPFSGPVGIINKHQVLVVLRAKAHDPFHIIPHNFIFCNIYFC